MSFRSLVFRTWFGGQRSFLHFTINLFLHFLNFRVFTFVSFFKRRIKFNRVLDFESLHHATTFPCNHNIKVANGLPKESIHLEATEPCF
ncbi:hypothetical protein HMPREF0541_01291 [Lacticaseibacillus rhamnosus ATCC 21052]|nr:hypothetical protein HMPREF0541_01291 [Lacticaseibacillus rhamnosus ATCC 21052]